MIPAARPYLPPETVSEMAQGVRQVLESGRLILGEQTKQFEAEFAQVVGVPHAIAVSSCSAALEILCRFFRVQGRRVLLPTNTFLATAAAVIRAGGSPVLCDMAPDTFGIDTDQAQQLITDELDDVALVIVTHLAGVMDPRLWALRETCAQWGVPLIEDCAHALGAWVSKPEKEDESIRAGALGQAGAFSFYPSKILTTGVGGMITTESSTLADYARTLRYHGSTEGLRVLHVLGSDWLMSELQAVLGRAQLRRLDDILTQRRALAETYSNLLEHEVWCWVEIPKLLPRTFPAYYKLPALLRLTLSSSLQRVIRDRLLQELQARNIEAGTLYDPPLHRQPALRPWRPFLPCPTADRVLSRQLCLPFYPGLQADEAQTVVHGVRASIETLVDEGVWPI